LLGGGLKPNGEQTTHLSISKTPIVVGVSVVRLEPNGFTEIGNSLVVLLRVSSRQRKRFDYQDIRIIERGYSEFKTILKTVNFA
jgi:hypothetical protein